MHHIAELQHKLMEAQGIERIKPYTASVRFQKDIENLSKIGMTSEDILFIGCSYNVYSEAEG